MNAALISLGSTSSQWTAEAMKVHYDEVDSLNLKELEVKLGPEAGVYHNGIPIKKYDCVYIKGSFRYAHLLGAMSSLLHGHCYLPIQPRAYTIVHNKLLTHLELQRNNIPMPRTYISPTIKEAKVLLKTVNYPIVMKFPQGTQGKGVMFAESEGSASSMLDALGALNQPFIIQEYVESGNVDIRAFVIGDRVVASMIRVAKGDENRANMHAGGEGKPYDLDRQERQVAIQTARALGTEICGVDLLKGPKGPLVIEANISPGLQGITAVTKTDIASKVAKYLFEKTKELTTASKKSEAARILDEKLQSKQQIITNLTFKGDRIVLPEIITKITGFEEKADYTIKAEKGKVEIEEFKVGK
jgi:ribosomal protein S6--L-glutamate ligase